MPFLTKLWWCVSRLSIMNSNRGLITMNKNEPYTLLGMRLDLSFLYSKKEKRLPSKTKAEVFFNFFFWVAQNQNPGQIFLQCIYRDKGEHFKSCTKEQARAKKRSTAEQDKEVPPFNR